MDEIRVRQRLMEGDEVPDHYGDHPGRVVPLKMHDEVIGTARFEAVFVEKGWVVAEMVFVGDEQHREEVERLLRSKIMTGGLNAEVRPPRLAGD